MTHAPWLQPGDLDASFLAEHEQPPADTATRLADFLHGAERSLDIAIYDRTQMQDVLVQWRDVPHNHWKIGAVRDIVADARLVGKHSTPYSPRAPHDFMHNKVLVVDHTVITGSYNFSRSAEFNAENILLIENTALADAYSAYIDHLMAKYQPDSVGDISV